MARGRVLLRRSPAASSSSRRRKGCWCATLGGWLVHKILGLFELQVWWGWVGAGWLAFMRMMVMRMRLMVDDDVMRGWGSGDGRLGSVGGVCVWVVCVWGVAARRGWFDGWSRGSGGGRLGGGGWPGVLRGRRWGRERSRAGLGRSGCGVQGAGRLRWCGRVRCALACARALVFGPVGGVPWAVLRVEASVEWFVAAC